MTKKTILVLLLVFIQYFYATTIYAADLVLTGSISGNYSATGTISTQGNCYVSTGASASLTSPNAKIFNSGFHVILGGSLSLPFDSDNDGLSDSWENTYFGNLNHTGTGDYDSDGLSNYLEFIMGFNPAVASIDHDSDGIPDWYELQEYGNLYHDETEGNCACD